MNTVIQYYAYKSVGPVQVPLQVRRQAEGIHCLRWRRLHQVASSFRPHCKDTIPKIRKKYSQQRNCAASVPISKFCVCERFIYSQGPSAGKYVDRLWEYINRSQTHECGNWAWCRAISVLGIHKWNFRCSAASSHPSTDILFMVWRGQLTNKGETKKRKVSRQ